MDLVPCPKQRTLGYACNKRYKTSDLWGGSPEEHQLVKHPPGEVLWPQPSQGAMLATGAEPTVHLARDMLLLPLRARRSNEGSVPSHDSQKNKTRQISTLGKLPTLERNLVVSKFISWLILLFYSCRFTHSLQFMLAGASRLEAYWFFPPYNSACLKIL